MWMGPYYSSVSNSHIVHTSQVLFKTKQGYIGTHIITI